MFENYQAACDFLRSTGFAFMHDAAKTWSRGNERCRIERRTQTLLAGPGAGETVRSYELRSWKV